MICPKYYAFRNISGPTYSLPPILTLNAALCVSVAVVADVYSVESSAYIDTLALLKVSGMSLVKFEQKSRGLNSYPGEFLILPGLCLIGFH